MALARQDFLGQRIARLPKRELEQRDSKRTEPLGYGRVVIVVREDFEGVMQTVDEAGALGVERVVLRL